MSNANRRQDRRRYPNSASPARGTVSYTESFLQLTVKAVEFQGVSKSYAIYDAPGDRLKELLSFHRLKRHRDFWALHDISFEVGRGERFCIVGENGSGKSTMLQMIAGILPATSGTLSVNGRVSALLELGAGFNQEFTGRRGVQPGVHRPRQRLPERFDSGPHHPPDRPALPGHRELRRDRRLHQPAREDLLQRYGGAAGLRRGHQRGSRDPVGG
ncbi:hypothetical protein SBA3_960011 [Candidatus Sulfopaludibacter sp. SbA3]|nr:hypothetical protein SBA3_960011 [Candidatus Sulfopaludibacter sp. SbA3]